MVSGREWENQSLNLPGDVARALGGVISGPPLSVALWLCHQQGRLFNLA